MKLNEETLGAGYYFAAISNRLAPGISCRASKLPMSATVRRIPLLTARIWHADKAGDDLPLLHRLAIIYLMVPLIIWLVGWFNWWFGIPAAALIILAFRPALSGFPRLSLPRPMTFAILLLAAVWMMSTAAGGVFDVGNADWNKHRSILLNLGYYPWPTFLPEPLAAYLPAEFSPPYLLRYHLGWYIVPGTFARLLGTAALNWVVPLWTWLGIALVLLLVIRKRRAWGVILAVVIFIFFGGLDILRPILLEMIGGSTEHIERRFEVKYLTNMHSFSWAPQHFIPAGLYTFLLLQLHRQPRFLAVSAILLATAPFWSSLVAIGLLPFTALLIWKNGLRPFLGWSNLALATALAGLIVIYLASGPLSLEQGWIWEIYDWPILARWIPMLYLTEFLLLALLLCALRPNLYRKHFFIVSLAILILVPLYRYGHHNDISMRASLPAIFVLCYYCTETLSHQAHATFVGAAGLWKRLGFAGIAVTLALGSLPAVNQLGRTASSVGIFRYEEVDLAFTLNVPVRVMDQYIAHDIPNLLGLLLDTDDSLPTDEKGGPVMQSHVDIHLKDDPELPALPLEFSTDTLATLAAARRILGSEQKPIFVAAGNYDEPWVRFIFSSQFESRYSWTFDFSRFVIFPADHASASYLFPFNLPHASLMDRYFDQSSAQTLGTSPSGRLITLYSLLDPRPPFEPEVPVPARFGDQIFVYGFDMPKDARAGETMTVRWYWRILAADQLELAFSNRILGEDGRPGGQVDRLGFVSGYWPVDTSGITTFEIDIDPETPTGAYWLRVAAYDRDRQDSSNLPIFDAQGNQAGNDLRLGPIKVHGRPPAPGPVPDHYLPATFADQIDLLGYSLSDHRLVPGGSLDLTLFWSPRGRPTHDYTVFVHLLDSQGQLRGQADSPPRSGKYPTSVWDAGEFIADLHTLSLPPDLPAGEYRLAVGLYDPQSGERVYTLDEDGNPTGDLTTISGLVVQHE